LPFFLSSCAVPATFCRACFSCSSRCTPPFLVAWFIV
jgi:hypothetical protein